jgi:Uncharacterized protein conserved in bacteria (DUF2130)
MIDIGGRWPRQQRTSRLIEAVRPNKKRHRVRAPLDAAHLHVNATARAVEGNLGGFCVVGTETVPARTTCRGRLCRNSGWVDHEEMSPTELVESPSSGSKSTECGPTISETQAMPNPMTEKEQQIAGMQRKIEDLLRKAEQGSQQAQGEVLEVELESQLRARFPRDLIEPVPKGEFGGDVLHHVFGASGQNCGTILWESKQTKAWHDGWLVKLRDDQRVAKAEIALIVSSALPKGVKAFDLVENVWVTEPRFAIPLAIALRQSLIDVAGSRLTQRGQQTKMALIYRYLTGPQFRHRIDAIVEKFTDMREDLDRERKVLTKLWARREEQLKCVLDSTAGLYGDLQGIAGHSMPELECLDILLIEGEAPENAGAGSTK